MGRVPHLLLPGPWGGEDAIAVPDSARVHLEKVLRLSSAAVTYTDGRGTVGTGRYTAGAVTRGRERQVPRPSPRVVVAVAPPRETARQRFVVEKLAELGVDRIDWLRTELGANRFPAPVKVRAWADAALEQSRGAWWLEFGGEVAPEDLGEDGAVLVADPEGAPLDVPAGPRVTVAIGPEGGFTDAELAAAGGVRFGLGVRILRVETAAVVAAGLVMRDAGRMVPDLPE